MHYIVKGPDNTIIGGTSKLAPAPSIDLSKAITGLRNGILGMQRGEVREIFIHPDFAYGRHCEYSGGAGKAVCVRVELVDFVDGTGELSAPELVSVDLVESRYPIDVKTQGQAIALQKRYMGWCGKKIGAHCKKLCDLLAISHGFNAPTLSGIMRELEGLQKDPARYQPLDEQSRQTLRRLHWLTYNQPS
jgi:hypothetical protein